MLRILLGKTDHLTDIKDIVQCLPLIFAQYRYRMEQEFRTKVEAKLLSPHEPFITSYFPLFLLIFDK